jgi:plastocyanin
MTGASGSNGRVRHWRAVLVSGLALSLMPRVSAATGSVKVQDFGFLPDEINLSVGDQVTWLNTGEVTHTVVSNRATQERFDSGTMEPGKTFRHTFTSSGTFSYSCEIYPPMRGLIRVAEPDTKTTGATAVAPLDDTTTTTPTTTTGARTRGTKSRVPATVHSPELSQPMADHGPGTASSAPHNRVVPIAGAKERDDTTPPSGSASTASAPPPTSEAPSAVATPAAQTPSPPAKGTPGEDQGAVGDIGKDTGGGVKALRVLGILPFAGLVVWAIWDSERRRRHRPAHRTRAPSGTGSRGH